MQLNDSFSDIHYVHDAIWKSLTFILVTTWCGTFV